MRALTVSVLAAAVLAGSVTAADVLVRNLDDGHVGTTPTELEAQLDHSRDVVEFFVVGPHAWMRAPRRSSCWSFEGRRRRHVCDRARRELVAHRWLLSVAEQRLADLYPWVVVCDVFGPECSDAQAVALCESHFHVWAANGQYLGMFQMGTSERRTYGHGSDAWTQSEAARRYFLAAGGWGPWECKP